MSTPALVTYLVLLHLHRRRMIQLGPEKRKFDIVATVVASRASLSKLTGYSERALDKAIKELNNAKLIETVRRRKRAKNKFDGVLAGAVSNRYYLINPDSEGKRALETMGRVNVLPNNKVPYFTAPEVVISNHEQPWAISKLNSSEIRLYLSMLSLADRDRRNTFEAAASKIRSIAQIEDKRTFSRGMDRLESLGLISFNKLETTTRNSPDLQITVCDPLTGEPVEDLDEKASSNLANYYVEKQQGSKKFILNLGTETERMELLKSFLPSGAPTIPQGNGNVTIQCPYHDDSTPSCSVSVQKRCFQCFGCGEKGTLFGLLTKLKGGETSETVQQIAAHRGQSVIFRDPDSDAIAIYSYRNTDGRLLKQVLRFPDENGNKVIRQRRLASRGGWLYNLRGVGPLLYHRELVSDSDVVMVTEGEKDADTITKLELRSNTNGRVIGVTSGGADSWDDSLAEPLIGKRVVVMPDADEAGEKFRSNVVASLISRRIEYRVVTFDGTGSKDVTEYMECHSRDELTERIGTDLLQPPAPTEDEEWEEISI